jgi:hypothetical protein
MPVPSKRLPESTLAPCSNDYQSTLEMVGLLLVPNLLLQQKVALITVIENSPPADMPRYAIDFVGEHVRDVLGRVKAATQDFCRFGFGMPFQNLRGCTSYEDAARRLQVHRDTVNSLLREEPPPKGMAETLSFLDTIGDILSMPFNSTPSQSISLLTAFYVGEQISNANRRVLNVLAVDGTVPQVTSFVATINGLVLQMGTLTKHPDAPIPDAAPLPSEISGPAP